MPPPLSIRSEWEDEEVVEEDDGEEVEAKMEEDTSTGASSMFASTESVLHHLGSDFERDFSPCSVLDIADPVVVARKQPFKHE